MISFRHGDVIIHKINELPEGVRESDVQTKDMILAYGEVTGHKHELVEKENVTEFFKVMGRIYFRLNKETVITHEEHGPKVLPPGIYKSNIAIETDHITGVTRQVAD